MNNLKLGDTVTFDHSIFKKYGIVVAEYEYPTENGEAYYVVSEHNTGTLYCLPFNCFKMIKINKPNYLEK